jgi:hypothetical protein
MLFHRTKEATQVDYKLRHFPLGKLTDAIQSRIRVSSEPRVLRKATILADLSDCGNYLLFNKQRHKIHWMYNNVPSEDEWGRKSGGYFISIVFRSFINSSRELENIVILSFASPDEIRRSGETI